MNELLRRGMRCITEAGREIIQEQVRIGGTALPWDDVRTYRELMLAREIQAYRSNLDNQKPIFFDRGIVDVLGYSNLIGLTDNLHLHIATKHYRYNPQVLIAPPWKEIYENDTERKQTFQESEATFEAMVLCYEAAGYSLIELPLASVESRADFILEFVQKLSTRDIDLH